MAYKKTGKAPEATTEVSIELDKKKQVTVRSFNGVNLVDIREFYIDSATQEKKPGKKGISLTEDVWRKLLESKDEIEAGLAALNGKKRKPEAEEDESGKEAKKAKTEPKGDEPEAEN